MYRGKGLVVVVVVVKMKENVDRFFESSLGEKDWRGQAGLTFCNCHIPYMCLLITCDIITYQKSISQPTQLSTDLFPI